MTDEKKVEIPQAPVEQDVRSMSHRQLRNELRRAANRGYEGKGFVMNGVDFGDTKKKKTNAGLSNAWATVLGVILDNTTIDRVIDAECKPPRIARPDQIGPGKLSSYPR